MNLRQRVKKLIGDPKATSKVCDEHLKLLGMVIGDNAAITPPSTVWLT